MEPCNLSDVEQQGDSLKKSTKPWTLQTWMAGDDDGDWTVFGGSQQSLPWCCGLMDAISSGAYRIHPGSFREGRKKFKPNEGWPHLGRDDFLTDFWMNETYIYIYLCFCFLFVHVDLPVLSFLFLCTGRCLRGCFLGWTCICRTDSCKAGPVGAGFHFQRNLDVPGT